jgi:DNA modification methylase
LILDTAREANPEARSTPEDTTPALAKQAVTRLGDVWQLGRHRLICADARDLSTYAALMGDEQADVLFTDPPYNVPIDGFVGGKGKVERREFAMASGEMSRAEFVDFLEITLGAAARHARDGAIAFVCMDWRHMAEVLAAGETVFDELKNLCVWTKSNGGMGSLYRSQHELVFVFKKGAGAHVNNVELGRFGRNRTNVWAYAGANSFKQGRNDELAMHPTVKPVALVEDAIKDVSDRGGLVLDPFGGSGSTLIAAERCGRSSRLIELDPLYCDVIVRRFEDYAGKRAQLAGANKAFEEIAEERLARAV